MLLRKVVWWKHQGDKVVSKPKYQYYEIIKIETSDPNKLQFNGKEGAVLGIAYDDDKNFEPEWGYSIHIYEEEECWRFTEYELKPTGKFDKRESFYDGTSIQVTQDGDIVEEE